MLLIVITQILFWVFVGLLLMTGVLSFKGILSPKFTLILITFFGVFAFLCSTDSTPKSELPIIIEPQTLLEDTPPQKMVHHDKGKIDNVKEEPLEEKLIPGGQDNVFESQESETVEIEKSEDIKNSIPQDYEVIDVSLRTYKTKGAWDLGKPFIKYFEEKTGWRKIKKGNYEIEVSHRGKFTQKNSETERVYIYSGGEVEIKVNGKLCCCSTVFSIPSGLSDSKLVKAQRKLEQSISDLIFENKEGVIVELQKCL